MPTPEKIADEKPIRSFVRRTGRFTARQKNAIQAKHACLVDIRNGIITEPTTTTILEIGFGMGHSFLEMAKAAPDTQFIGIEVYQPGIGTVLAAIQEENLQNILIIAEDAKEALPACIANNSLDGVNIFFSDPWPKTRHHKRRLIQPDFVALIQTKLKPGGCLHLATDWEDYANHMLDVLSHTPSLSNTASDGGFSKTRHNRPMTKYEKRGLTLGHPVWDLVFVSN
ncbi:MAG: tRNA ((46)-N7)-methyltransferase TrmB [Gammaproteobacteria bacterium]|jgi:tRNA (guanine-N7-)-methyltransferase|nr:tRNA ((46)-N7)-methyltransferase TrmB [Gammaproteobacteria bacterium]